MSTPRFRASNRRNAEFSTGPVTERGRAAVRANAFQHGFYARLPIDDAESHEEYRTVLDDFLADLRPAGAVEIELTHRYVATLWKLSRMERAERSIILGHATTTPFEYPELDGHAGQQAFLNFRDWVEVSMCQYTHPGQAPIERLHLLQNRLRRGADSTINLLTTLQAERLRSAAFAPSASSPDANSALDANFSLDANSAFDPLHPSATASSIDPVKTPPAHASSIDPVKTPSAHASSINPGKSPAPPPPGPRFSPAGEDRARRVHPEVRERARQREQLALRNATPEPAGSSSPAAPTSPAGSSPIEAPSEPTQPGSNSTPPASKIKPAQIVTPPTPSIQKPNPGIGFVPHVRKSGRRATPQSPPKAPPKAA